MQHQRGVMLLGEMIVSEKLQHETHCAGNPSGKLTQTSTSARSFDGVPNIPTAVITTEAHLIDATATCCVARRCGKVIREVKNHTFNGTTYGSRSRWMLVNGTLF